MPSKQGNMRIISFYIFLFVIGAEMANAQPYLNIGVRAGGNSSSIKFVPPIRERIASVTGYQIGGSLQYLSKEHLGIQVDGLLINQGWRTIADDLTETIHKIDFLHFPFTTYAYAGKKKTRFFVNAGIYFNVRMNGERTVIQEDGTRQTFDYHYQKERDNLVVYGLTGGGGLSYDIGFGVIGADARISYSFGNLIKPEIPIRDFSRETVISITGFYMFNILNKKSARVD